MLPTMVETVIGVAIKGWRLPSLKITNKNKIVHSVNFSTYSVILYSNITAKSSNFAA